MYPSFAASSVTNIKKHMLEKHISTIRGLLRLVFWDQHAGHFNYDIRKQTDKESY